MNAKHFSWCRVFFFAASFYFSLGISSLVFAQTIKKPERLDPPKKIVMPPLDIQAALKQCHVEPIEWTFPYLTLPATGPIVTTHSDELKTVIFEMPESNDFGEKEIIAEAEEQSPAYSFSVSPATAHLYPTKNIQRHDIRIKNEGDLPGIFCYALEQKGKDSQSIRINGAFSGPSCVEIPAGDEGSTYFVAEAIQFIPDDKLMNKVIVTLQGCEEKSKSWYSANRGGFPEVTDHPDEIEGASVISNGTPAPITADAEVVVMFNGFFDATLDLLGKLNEPAYMVLEDLSPIDPDSKPLKEYPILILPSGALMGLDSSALVKSMLDDYVSSGGVLIAFSQQRGYEFAALPGGKLSGYGWREDQSCLANAAFIDAYHPIFASQTKTNIDANIDGYFLTWPDDATILLRRVKNNYPAMLVYPYGEGFVLATTMYPDFGLLSGQTTPDELNFMRDLLAWAKNPRATFTESKPQEQMTLTLQLVNSTPQNANSVKLTMKDSAGQTVREETVTVPVPAGQTVSYVYTFLAPSSLGNYTVSYALLFDTQEVQAQAFADSFSVSEHLQSTTPAPELQFSVNAPGDTFPLNFPITFTIRITNNGETERTLTLSKTSHGGGGEIGAFTVPAQSELVLPYTTSAVYWFDRNVVHDWIWDMYLEVRDGQTGRELVSGWTIGVGGKAYTPSVTASAAADKKSYGPNGEGAVSVALTNTGCQAITCEAWR